MSWMWSSEKARPSGIRGCTSPRSTCIRGLCPGAPGLTAAPWRAPPERTESRLSTEKPLVRVCRSWQGRQLACRTGSTRSWKSTAAWAGSPAIRSRVVLRQPLGHLPRDDRNRLECGDGLSIQAPHGRPRPGRRVKCPASKIYKSPGSMSLPLKPNRRAPQPPATRIKPMRRISRPMALGRGSGSLSQKTPSRAPSGMLIWRKATT